MYDCGGIGEFVHFSENLAIEENTAKNKNQNQAATELLATFEEQNDLRGLICKRFGFEEMVYKHLIENGFDTESLLVATESEINDLFPAPLLGTRAKFKFHLNVWRKDQAANVSDACREWIESTCQTSTPNFNETQRNLSSATSSSSSYCDEPLISNDITLKSLLKETEKGRGLLHYYERHHRLDETNQKTLISIIVNCYNKGIKMRDIEAATNAIHCVFPSESKISAILNYAIFICIRGRGLNPIGKLHDRAVNERIKLKRQLNQNKNQETAANDAGVCQPRCFISGEAEQTIIWLAHNNEPWPDVQNKWTDVLKERHQDIQTEGSNILTKWPLFKHSLGHTLVSRFEI